MLVVLVHIHVKAEFVDAFIQATIENARNSNEEAGIARFDFIQREDDPTWFTLIEAYRSEDAPVKHKETAHYVTWRDTVVEMMAEPRSGVKYQSIFPDESGW
jgi:quinol monooxygenase YgiN